MNVNSSILRLFKAVEVPNKRNKKPLKAILQKTVPLGFIFSSRVFANYTKTELESLITSVKQEYSISGEEANNTFHKSWNKIRNTPIFALMIEQIVHYITTYGFETLGIYDESTVYVPYGKLDIPELKEDKAELIVINGYTKQEIKDKLIKLLNSGIALKEGTVKDCVAVSRYVDISSADIAKIANREVKIALYDAFGDVPKDPVEFLRYVIYKLIDSTLLIKNKKTIALIKEKCVSDKKIVNDFSQFFTLYGDASLATIFYRFKPIFLAMRDNSTLKPSINRIRRLATKHHIPMKLSYLDTITGMIKRGDCPKEARLKKELDKVNTFRKLRLAGALRYRLSSPVSNLIKIRSGVSHVEEMGDVGDLNVIKKTLNIVIDSIIEAIKPKIDGKTIYLPENISYGLPTTEKQFIGNVPCNTCISVKDKMIAGIHWFDVDSNRIDLDLSMIKGNSKIGWNGCIRNTTMMFSGDITSAPKPRGASELFYIDTNYINTEDNDYIVMLNYFNYDSDIPVPFKIIIGHRQDYKQGNYMIDPNNIITSVKTVIDTKQKVLGLLVIDSVSCNKFYFMETSMGSKIASSPNDPDVIQSLAYLKTYATTAITLNDLLALSGGIIVSDTDKKGSCDINLDINALEKDTIINLLQ